MEKIGNSQIDISTLNVGPNFASLGILPEVIELAESIETYGMIEPIVVRQHDSKLIAGRRRVAAARLAGMSYVSAELVSCSDEELLELEIEENLRRHHYTLPECDMMAIRVLEARVARLTLEALGTEFLNSDPTSNDEPNAARQQLFHDEIVTAEARQVRPNDEPNAARQQLFHDEIVIAEARKKPGPKRSQLAQARIETAKVLGVSDTTIRRAEGRMAGKDSDVPPIDLYDLDLPYSLIERARGQVASFSAIDKHMRAAQVEITKAEKVGDLDTSTAQRWREDARRLGHEARASIPVSVCLYCKCTKADCATCGGSGLMSKPQHENLPNELTYRGAKAGIFVNGKFRPLGAP